MNLILEPVWRPGESITTPTTRLSWATLGQWCDAWQQLHHRCATGRKYDQQKQKHLEALPLEMIQAEEDAAVLDDFLRVVPAYMRIPHGLRANHPATPLLQAANNRLSQLERSG